MRAPSTVSSVAVPRNRYVDLLRVCAIVAVVFGHWLLTAVTYRGGRLSGVDALNDIDWGRWLTLLFQVIPVFFLVGGYANAVSWTEHRARGEGWTGWVRGRAMPLLWATTVYVVVAVLVVVLARAAGATGAELSEAAWFTALHLWFIPTYLLMIALTPLMFAAHRRWGLAVPTVMAIIAAAVDGAVIGWRVPLIGFANYLLVWGSIHQWGFAWQGGSLTHPRSRPPALFAGGVVSLAALLGPGPFPVDMIGSGQRINNTSPPSVALLSLAAAQAGLLLMLEPTANRLLSRDKWWRPVHRINALVITLYLWHMAPVVIVALAFYTTGMVPQPAIGTPLWWALRPAWFAVLWIVLVPLAIAVTWLERPLRRVPPGFGPDWPGSAVLLAVGLTAAAVGLGRFAIAGFAPTGRPAVTVLIVYLSGLVLVLLSGHVAMKHASMS